MMMMMMMMTEVKTPPVIISNILLALFYHCASSLNIFVYGITYDKFKIIFSDATFMYIKLGIHFLTNNLLQPYKERKKGKNIYIAMCHRKFYKITVESIIQ